MGLCFRFVLNRDDTRGKVSLQLSRSSAKGFSVSLPPSKKKEGRHWEKEAGTGNSQDS